MFNETDLVMLTLRRPLVPAVNEPGYSFHCDGLRRVMIGGVACVDGDCRTAGDGVLACLSVSSPLLTTLPGRIERRRLLFGLLLLLAVGNVVCGFASSYSLMLTGRIVAALGTCLFSQVAVPTPPLWPCPQSGGARWRSSLLGRSSR